jgi:ribonuclease HII
LPVILANAGIQPSIVEVISFFKLDSRFHGNDNSYMNKPTFHHERQLISRGYRVIAGVDEVGCGALAGPVYAAAVILPLDSRLSLIRDSKQLSPAQRISLFEAFQKKNIQWGLGIATHQEVDKLNVRQAGLLAMRHAIEALAVKADAVISDAFSIPDLDVPCIPIIRGDRLVKSVAAASIVAKVERDTFMQKMDETYPGYGFAQHKGYGTKQHQKALALLGPSPIHRKTFLAIFS